VAESEDDCIKLIGNVVGKDEGGYQESSKMLGESTLTLAFSLPEVKQNSGKHGGLLTTAVMGHTLLRRLREKGMDFDVTER